MSIKPSLISPFTKNGDKILIPGLICGKSENSMNPEHGITAAHCSNTSFVSRQFTNRNKIYKRIELNVQNTDKNKEKISQSQINAGFKIEETQAAQQ